MSHLDAYLDPCMAYGWEGSPRFRTLVTDLENGDEYRNAEWMEARHEYTAPFMNISKDAYREVKKMFMVCRGMLHAFRFIDVLDYQATSEQFGTGDGATAEYQLSKLSTVDGVSYTRNVYALANTPVITVNGAPTTDFTVNPRNGKILFDTAPANGAILRWTGEFDIWVRFTTDSIPFTLDSIDATNGQVGVMEVPAPDEELWT
jgi:uncharacterized protein (TIGR02217 family)